MKESPESEGVIAVDEEKDENANAATNKFDFRSGDGAQWFYSKLQKLQKGAPKSAALFCISMFIGAILVTRLLDVVCFSITAKFVYAN